MFVPDYVNDLVKVVAIFGVIHHATAPAHNVFCYSAVAHILTPSVNLVFRPKSGFKNKYRARAGVRLQSEALFETLCGYVGRGQQGEIEKINPPPTNVIID